MLLSFGDSHTTAAPCTAASVQSMTNCLLGSTNYTNHVPIISELLSTPSIRYSTNYWWEDCTAVLCIVPLRSGNTFLENSGHVYIGWDS